jgi:hypothetical protein
VIKRWGLKLQEYNFTVEHIKGPENFSDILSRALNWNMVKTMNSKRNLVIPL